MPLSPRIVEARLALKLIRPEQFPPLAIDAFEANERGFGHEALDVHVNFVPRRLDQSCQPTDHGTVEDFQDPYSGYQLGLPPSQIDVIFAISAVSFEEAWRDSVPGQTGDGTEVRYISLEHLIRNKRAAGHLQDFADAAALENSRAANAKTDQP